jgi:exopolysaccharide production protein ExoQ
MSATLVHPVDRSVSFAPARVLSIDGDPLLFRRARTWWTILALFLIAQGNGLFTRQDQTYWNVRDVNVRYFNPPELLLATIALWLLCLLLMFGHVRATLRTMLQQRVVLAFSLLAFASTLWSQDPLLTLRKAVLLFLICAFAWFIASCYSPADQVRLLVAAGLIVALACVAMALFLPEYGISKDGEWKGIFGHKNRMGLGILYLFSSLPFCAIPNFKSLAKVTLLAILPLGLILLSQSKTSLIMAAVLVAVRFLGPRFVRMRKEHLPFALFALFIGLALAAFVLVAGEDLMLSLLGRNATLTGRTEHWAILYQYFLDHRWLGYGFQAFWTGSGDSLSVIRQVNGVMKGSDSGYVDLMLQFGLLGLGLLLGLMLMCLRNFARLFQAPAMPLVALWYAGLILTTFLGSVTETLFPLPVGINMFVFVLACAGLTNLANHPSTRFARITGRW